MIYMLILDNNGYWFKVERIDIKQGVYEVVPVNMCWASDGGRRYYNPLYEEKQKFTLHQVRACGVYQETEDRLC